MQVVFGTNLDVAELVVVALEAIDAHAQKGTCGSAGQPNGIGLIRRAGIGGGRDKVGRRLSGPDSFVGEQLTDELIVRRVFNKLVGEPERKAATAEDKEGAPFVADVNSRQPLGPVIGEAAVLQ